MNSINESHSYVQKFLMFIRESLSESQQFLPLISKRIKEANEAYVASKDFENFLEDTMRKIIDNPSKSFKYVRDSLNELKSHTTSVVVKHGSSTHKRKRSCDGISNKDMVSAKVRKGLTSLDRGMDILDANGVNLSDSCLNDAGLTNGSTVDSALRNHTPIDRLDSTSKIRTDTDKDANATSDNNDNSPSRIGKDKSSSHVGKGKEVTTFNSSNNDDAVTHGPSISNHRSKTNDVVTQSSQQMAPKKCSDRQLRRLETILEKLSAEIQKCKEREMTLDDLDQADSYYLYEDKLECKLWKVWCKICELKGRSVSTGRVSETQFIYQGTRYPEINRRITRLINKMGIFPDYQDILSVVQRANTKYNLMLSESKCTRLSRDMLEEIGTQLKRRRQRDLRDTIGYSRTDELGRLHEDPAENNPELRRKLAENKRVAGNKMDEVMSKYTKKQLERKLKQGDESHSSNGDDDDDDDDDDDQSSQEGADKDPFGDEKNDFHLSESSNGDDDDDIQDDDRDNDDDDVDDDNENKSVCSENRSVSCESESLDGKIDEIVDSESLNDGMEPIYLSDSDVSVSEMGKVQVRARYEDSSKNDDDAGTMASKPKKKTAVDYDRQVYERMEKDASVRGIFDCDEGGVENKGKRPWGSDMGGKGKRSKEWSRCGRSEAKKSLVSDVGADGVEKSYSECRSNSRENKAKSGNGLMDSNGKTEKPEVINVIATRPNLEKSNGNVYGRDPKGNRGKINQSHSEAADNGHLDSNGGVASPVASPVCIEIDDGTAEGKVVPSRHLVKIPKSPGVARRLASARAVGGSSLGSDGTRVKSSSGRTATDWTEFNTGTYGSSGMVDGFGRRVPGRSLKSLTSIVSALHDKSVKTGCLQTTEDNNTSCEYRVEDTAGNRYVKRSGKEKLSSVVHNEFIILDDAKSEESNFRKGVVIDDVSNKNSDLQGIHFDREAQEEVSTDRRAGEKVEKSEIAVVVDLTSPISVSKRNFPVVTDLTSPILMSQKVERNLPNAEFKRRLEFGSDKTSKEDSYVGTVDETQGKSGSSAVCHASDTKTHETKYVDSEMSYGQELYSETGVSDGKEIYEIDDDTTNDTVSACRDIGQDNGEAIAENNRLMIESEPVVININDDSVNTVDVDMHALAACQSELLVETEVSLGQDMSEGSRNCTATDNLDSVRAVDIIENEKIEISDDTQIGSENPVDNDVVEILANPKREGVEGGSVLDKYSEHTLDKSVKIGISTEISMAGMRVFPLELPSEIPIDTKSVDPSELPAESSVDTTGEDPRVMSPHHASNHITTELPSNSDNIDCVTNDHTETPIEKRGDFSTEKSVVELSTDDEAVKLEQAMKTSKDEPCPSQEIVKYMKSGTDELKLSPKNRVNQTLGEKGMSVLNQHEHFADDEREVNEGSPRKITDNKGSPRKITEHKGSPGKITYKGSPRKITDNKGSPRKITDNKGSPGKITNKGSPGKITNNNSMGSSTCRVISFANSTTKVISTNSFTDEVVCTDSSSDNVISLRSSPDKVISMGSSAAEVGSTGSSSDVVSMDSSTDTVIRMRSSTAEVSSASNFTDKVMSRGSSDKVVSTSSSNDKVISMDSCTDKGLSIGSSTTDEVISTGSSNDKVKSVYSSTDKSFSTDSPTHIVVGMDSSTDKAGSSIENKVLDIIPAFKIPDIASNGTTSENYADMAMEISHVSDVQVAKISECRSAAADCSQDNVEISNDLVCVIESNSNDCIDNEDNYCTGASNELKLINVNSKQGVNNSECSKIDVSMCEIDSTSPVKCVPSPNADSMAAKNEQSKFFPLLDEYDEKLKEYDELINHAIRQSQSWVSHSPGHAVKNSFFKTSKARPSKARHHMSSRDFTNPASQILLDKEKLRIDKSHSRKLIARVNPLDSGVSRDEAHRRNDRKKVFRSTDVIVLSDSD